MKGVLLLNGEPFSGEIECENAYVVCCDGAYNWARRKVKIDENLGDFDSVNCAPYPPPSEVFAAEKDYTDGELGLRRLMAKGVGLIEIYGGGGGRDDHFVGNLHLLYLAHSAGVNAEMHTNRGKIFAAGGKIELNCEIGATVSLLPFGGAVHIIDSTGLKYAYPPEIAYGQSRGLSNVVLSGGASVTLAEGDCALIFVNRGKV